MAEPIVIVNYVYRAPYPSEVTGFKPGVILLNKHPLSGSDLGVNSHWVVKEINDKEVVFYPLSARGLNSTRSRPLTGFVPYAARGLHTTKSYFEPLPLHTHAII